MTIESGTIESVNGKLGETGMKIKVDAELYDALLWGAEILQAQITMEELAHEATRKAYMMLTAAHNTALLAATEMVLRPTVVQADVTLEIAIDSLAWDEWHKGILGNKAPDIKLSSHGKAFSAGWDAAMAAKRYRPVNSKQENQTPIRKDMDAPGMY